MRLTVAETVDKDDALTSDHRQRRALSVTTGVRRLPTSIVRWLVSDARDVVTLVRRAPARPDAAADAESQDLAAPLRRFRRAVALWRMVAVLRRWLIVAVVLSVALALVRWLIWSLPVWAVIALPLAVMAAGVIPSALRSPGQAAVARWLDRRLALKEQVSSALEAPRDTENRLVPLLQARARVLAVRARGEWRARPVRAGAEWAVLIVGLVLLALLLTFGRPASGARHRILARPTHSTAAPHLRSIRTTVISIPASSSSTSPSVPRRIARRLAIQARGLQGAGQRSRSGVKQRGKQKGAVIPPGRASQAAFPSRKQGSAGASSGGRGAGNQSGSPLQTSRRSAAGSQPRTRGTKSGSSGKTVSIRGPRLTGARGGVAGRRTAAGNASKTGGGQAGGRGVRQSNPYGPTPSYLHNLPKPGLLTGPAISSKGPTHGSNAAGRGRGANGHGSSRPLRGAKGRQLQLKSAYGSTAGSAQKSSLTARGSQHRTAHVRGGPGGTGASDYIPPDAHSVSWEDSPIVARYFTPGGSGLSPGHSGTQPRATGHGGR